MKIQVRSKKNPIHYNTKNLKLLQNSQFFLKTTTGGCVVGRENETLLMRVGGMVASS
jgi:hypothetical protein